MGTQNIGCAACGQTYPLPTGATEALCPACGHPYSAANKDSAERGEAPASPDPDGAAIGRIPLRRKRVSKSALAEERRQPDASGDLPRRPQEPVEQETRRADDARRALEDDDLRAGYGRAVVPDLSVPGLDPPPLPVDSEPNLELRRNGEEASVSSTPASNAEELRTAKRKARPAAIPPQRRRPRKGPLEVGVPAAPLEQHATEGNSAIMVFVPDAPARDEEPAAERIGGGHRRRSQPTASIGPRDRPRVRHPTSSQGIARATPEQAKGGSAWPWLLFLVGLLGAVTLYLVLTR